MAEIRKAVITAAGRGTRQYPATNTLQKELFPLVDTDGYAKPTVQIVVEEALASGIEEVCIVANPSNAEPIRAHFQGLTSSERARFTGKDWALALSDRLDDIKERLTVVVQETQEGYGHAVYQARAWAGGEPFALLVGDHISFTAGGERCTQQMVDLYRNHPYPISSVARIPSPQMQRYGTAAGEAITNVRGPLYTMRAMAEKPTEEYAQANLRTPGLPENEYLCFYGIHVFPSAVFDCLQYLIDRDERQRGEIQMADAQRMLFEQGRYLLAEIKGEQFDMGVPDGLILTQLALALHSPYRDQARALFNTYQ